MPNIGICVIFNHPFPEQIALLRELYKSRFAKCMFILPFDLGQGEDVFTVYRGAFSFDGMIVDARNEIKHRFADCDYIVFIHNDLLLSPKINQSNIVDHFGLSKQAAYITACDKVNGPIDSWIWQYRLPHKINRIQDALLGSGAEKAFEYLPSENTIIENCSQAGFDPMPSQLTPPTGDKRPYYDDFICKYFFGNEQSESELNLRYPFFYGYSDLIIIKQNQFDKWVHVLGLLTALEVFEEISIPTSLIWSLGNIMTQKQAGLTSTILWSPEDRQKANDVDWALARLASDSYLHPMKLNSLTPEAVAAIRSAFALSPK